MKDDDYMSLNDAVKHVMKVTGKTRRQAEAAILRELKKGSIEAWGVPVVDGVELPVENIPPEVFQSIPTEH